MSLFFALGGCGTRCQSGGRDSLNPSVAPAPFDADFDFTPSEVLDASVALPICRVSESADPNNAQIDGGTESTLAPDLRAFAQRFASSSTAHAWIDRSAQRLHLTFGSTTLETITPIPSPSDSLLVLPSDSWLPDGGAAAEHWLVHLQATENGQRFRWIFQNDGGLLRRVVREHVDTDSDDNVSAVSVAGGALFLWTTTANNHLRIVSSRWNQRTPNTLSAPILVSDAAHDACEPTVISLSESSAGAQAPVLLAYLNNHDDPASNRSTADIFLRRLTATGEPSGPAVLITPIARPRYSVTLANKGASTWVAWRLGRDSESEGPVDGGIVAAVTLRADLRPLAEPDYISDPDVTPVGAMRMLPTQAGMDLFWLERRAEETVTVHRRLSVEGQGVGPPRDEPVFRGELPIGGIASRPLWFVNVGDGIRVRSGECQGEP